MSISHVTAEGGRRNLHTMVEREVPDWFDRVGLLLGCSGCFGCRRYPPPRAGAHIRPCRSASMPNPVPLRTGLAVDPPGEYEPHSGDSWGGAETTDDLLARRTRKQTLQLISLWPAGQFVSTPRLCDVMCVAIRRAKCPVCRASRKMCGSIRHHVGTDTKALTRRRDGL